MLASPGLLRSDPGGRAEADGEPKLAKKRLLNGGAILAGGAAKIMIRGEADAGSEACEAGVVAEAGVEAKGCSSEAGLKLMRMLVLKQMLVCGQASCTKSDDACP